MCCLAMMAAGSTHLPQVVGQQEGVQAAVGPPPAQQQQRRQRRLAGILGKLRRGAEMQGGQRGWCCESLASSASETRSCS